MWPGHVIPSNDQRERSIVHRYLADWPGKSAQGSGLEHPAISRTPVLRMRGDEPYQVEQILIDDTCSPHARG